MKYKYHKYIDEYIEAIRTGKVESSKEIKLMTDYVEFKLEQQNAVVRSDMIDDAVRVIEKYFNFKLLDWELFVLALLLSFTPDEKLVFDEVFLFVTRGAGKTTFLAALSWYFGTRNFCNAVDTSHYGCEIIANSESQAKLAFDDVYTMLDDNWSIMKQIYYKTKKVITNKLTHSTIQYNTSNSRTKDGKRGRMILVDEIHEMETFDNIDVFTSSLGKKKMGRVFYISTDGYIRGGVLDKMKELSKNVLNGEIKDIGFLPLLYKLDDKSEVLEVDEDTAIKNLEKANPSLPYFDTLEHELRKDLRKIKYEPHKKKEFLTKRCNLPAQDTFTVVAPWEKIKATNQPVPFDKLKGLECIGGIDYARTTDFTSCGLLFKYGGKRYWLQHTFVCHKALDLQTGSIKFPVEEMVEKGLMTIIRKDATSADDVASWFLEKAKKYNIKTIACDSYRSSLLKSKFQELGLPLQEVRSGPVTHAKVAPLVEQIFAEETLVFGDDPVMRWATNNTYVDINPKGNTTYKKIEPKTRKNDAFMALIHALSKDEELQEQNNNFMSLDVYTY
ncbi:Phage terminase-like protein, large subunit, contains N-terminal HTH domain [Orenia metallireducens]|uniref:Phage terminase-like protein, large subunit, contains N-terminal HTH domain n=1 Tax=Orenia metallireducens TaxID=1413210 RepID=A0A285G7K0_9FIRM|nr:terminase TerL endonuclease subunit [Orenia metallireducens]SNY19378.1 Phage terminase-like protein, large subunit, contains N-terminal HTH domain [Orenia metallireducens]